MSVLTRVVLTTAPTALTPQVIGPTRIDLSWSSVLGAASYRVYRGGVLVDSTTGLTSSSTGLTPSTLYSFRVASVGADGQEGPQGTQVSASTTAAADTTAPTAPVLGTPTQSGANSLIVPMTTASTDASGIASYSLERATSAAGPFTVINSAALFPYTDLGLFASTAYWYRARATDNATNVGAYSNIVTQTTTAQSSFQYYISPSGSDSNPGTASQPWAITALNTKRSTYAGTSVGLMDGTYNIRSILLAAGPTGGDYDNPALDIAGGTSGSPTIIKAVNARQAVITAKSGSTYGNTTAVNAMLAHTGQVNRGYVEFDGLKITGTNRWCIRVGIKNSSQSKFLGIKVRNCEFTDCNATAHFGSGINIEALEMNSCRGYEITNNYWHDSVGLSVGSADHYAAAVTWDSDSGLWEYNTSKSSGGGFFAKADGQYGCTLRYNYLDQTGLSQSSAIQDFNGFNGSAATTTDIHHNVLIGDLCRWGTDVSSNVPASADQNRLWNNVLISTEGGASRGGIIKTVAGRLRLFNNIIVDQASGDHGMFSVNIDAAAVFDRNLYYSTTASYQWQTYASASATSPTGYASFAAWKTATGYDANSPTPADPLFVPSGTDALRYQLQGSSPAKNIGLTNGNSGSTCDAGAWSNSPPSRIGCDFA